MKPGTESQNEEAQLPAFIRSLLEPRAYPHPVGNIELRQTHISFVLLTGPYAYKIKKAVDFGFVDYSSVEKRRHFCHEEIRLNNRLCPEIYLGVVEVQGTKERAWIGEGHHLLDYAVKMVQLPEGQLMDRLLSENRVTPEMVERIARRLAAFYRRARVGSDVSQYGQVKWILINIEENFVQTAPFIGQTLSAEQYHQVRDYTNRFIKDKRWLLQQRITKGYIREGHGDLRPANICISDGLCIFDCIEFSERLRCGDVASDIAFLAMELDRAGRPDLSEHFVKSFVVASGDSNILEPLGFYKVYRAYVRGKVESIKLGEPEISAENKKQSLESARAYFALAASYARGGHPVPESQGMSELYGDD